MHLFYTLEKSWTSAKDLEPGDTVVTLSGEKYKIEAIDKDYYDGIIVVYNFEVKDNHNYYVGDNQVLVHNDGGCTVSDKGSSGGENAGFGEVNPKLAELHIKLDTLADEHLLPQFKEIDPNLKVGYTGSFKTGTVGNPNKPTFGQPMDMSKYDIDYWIESDVLYEKFGSKLKANPEFRRILSKTPGFEGLKPNKKGFSIKFKPSSK